MNAANIGRPEVRARCLPLSRKDHAPASGENSSSGVRWWLIVRPQFEIPRLLPITTAGNISSPLAKRSAPFEPVPNGPTCEHLGPFGSAKPTLLFGDSRRCRVPRGSKRKNAGAGQFLWKVFREGQRRRGNVVATSPSRRSRRRNRCPARWPQRYVGLAARGRAGSA
jgi:hypothetical protein